MPNSGIYDPRQSQSRAKVMFKYNREQYVILKNNLPISQG